MVRSRRLLDLRLLDLPLLHFRHEAPRRGSYTTLPIGAIGSPCCRGQRSQPAVGNIGSISLSVSLRLFFTRGRSSSISTVMPCEPSRSSFTVVVGPPSSQALSTNSGEWWPVCSHASAKCFWLIRSAGILASHVRAAP